MAFFTDTHCHIHDPEFFPDGGDSAYKQAVASGVHRMVCVGTDIQSSKAALMFSEEHEDAYATFGIHPDESKKQTSLFSDFQEWCESHVTKKVIAIGEIGLDYHNMNSPREAQIALLEQQIDLALRLQLPISFHVREAFDDFWPVLNNFSRIPGVLHSFTDSLDNMARGLNRELYIGVNGIATFAPSCNPVTKAIPLNRILLETDSPFLTPVPLRGTINAPVTIPLIASYVAGLRDITVEELSRETEQNANRLFF